MLAGQMSRKDRLKGMESYNSCETVRFFMEKSSRRKLSENAVGNIGIPYLFIAWKLMHEFMTNKNMQ